MPEIHSRRVQAADLDLHYLECGEGPPVLLLHGWPTNAQLYRHVLPELGRTRRAIALDLPGFGQSEKRPDDTYSYYYYDRAITGFVEALGIERLSLVVHDLGGPLGLHWMMGQRERVTDLVLLNTLVFARVSWAIVAFGLATYTPGLRSYLTSQAGLAFAMRFGVSDKARITPEVAELYQAPYRSPEARRVLLRSVQSLHPKGLKTIEDGMATLDIPVTCIYGEDDRVLPDVQRTMARVKALLPQAQLHPLPGCGHFLQEDRPEEVTRLLVQTLG